MFYVKKILAEDCTIKIDITDENVFTTCPKCGLERMVDLSEVFEDGESDLFSTSVFCPDCSVKFMKDAGNEGE